MFLGCLLWNQDRRQSVGKRLHCQAAVWYVWIPRSNQAEFQAGSSVLQFWQLQWFNKSVPRWFSKGAPRFATFNCRDSVLCRLHTNMVLTFVEFPCWFHLSLPRGVFVLKHMNWRTSGRLFCAPKWRHVTETIWIRQSCHEVCRKTHVMWTLKQRTDSFLTQKIWTWSCFTCSKLHFAQIICTWSTAKGSSPRKVTKNLSTQGFFLLRIFPLLNQSWKHKKTFYPLPKLVHVCVAVVLPQTIIFRLSLCALWKEEGPLSLPTSKGNLQATGRGTSSSQPGCFLFVKGVVFFVGLWQWSISM